MEREALGVLKAYLGSEALAILESLTSEVLDNQYSLVNKLEVRNRLVEQLM